MNLPVPPFDLLLSMLLSLSPCLSPLSPLLAIKPFILLLLLLVVVVLLLLSFAVRGMGCVGQLRGWKGWKPPPGCRGSKRRETLPYPFLTPLLVLVPIFTATASGLVKKRARACVKGIYIGRGDPCSSSMLFRLPPGLRPHPLGLLLSCTLTFS